MHTKFKSIPIALILAAGLSAFTPGKTFGEQSCLSAYLTCNNNARGITDDDLRYAEYRVCDDQYVRCLDSAASGGAIWVFRGSLLPNYVVQADGGVTPSQAFGGGYYLLTTNTLGNIQPIQLAIGPWNGSNFVTAASVTNVEILTIPLGILFAFGPTNYDQAPWTDVGHAIQNQTTGLWELSWTPANYTQIALRAVISDTTNGSLSSVAKALPQLTQTFLTSPTYSAPQQFSFSVYGPVGGNKTIQFTRSLKAGTGLGTWTDLLTITNFTGGAEVQVSASNPTNRTGFYRAY